MPVLRAWSADTAAGATARRADIVLLSGAGLGPTAVAEQLGCSKQTVITWRNRYRTAGLAGLRDAPRSGRPVRLDATAVVRRTLEPPVPATGRWTTRSLAADLGISNVAVANIWREWGIVPLAGGQIRLLTDPVLDGPVSEVLGLFVDPPLRLLAVAPGAAPRPEPPPPDPRPGRGVDPGLVRLAAARPEPNSDGDPSALTAFLKQLDDGPPPVVLADGSPAKLIRWAAARRGVAVHVSPPGRSWSHLARVACLLAGATAAGQASVESMLAVLDDPLPLTWVRGN